MFSCVLDLAFSYLKDLSDFLCSILNKRAVRIAILLSLEVTGVYSQYIGV
jgi:hypothetical protein